MSGILSAARLLCPIVLGCCRIESSSGRNCWDTMAPTINGDTRPGKGHGPSISRGIREEPSEPSDTSWNPPILKNWTQADAYPEAQPEYDDSTWIKMHNPEEMTLLDCHYGYGWYRTEIRSSSARSATLFFEGYADRLLLFVDGALAGIAPHTSEDRKAGTRRGASPSSWRKGRIASRCSSIIWEKSKGIGRWDEIHGSRSQRDSPMYVDWNHREPVRGWKFRSALSIESIVSAHPE